MKSSMCSPEPPPPAEETWEFVHALQSPLWSNHGWKERQPTAAEASLAGGIRLAAMFDDPNNLLATAYDDLHAFLQAGGVRQEASYAIQTRQCNQCAPEEFRISVSLAQCVIEAGDTEGIRRGIFHIEDLMLRAGGPFLPLGDLQRRPVIRTRISRCFFGPINRPPRRRDELVDDVNYYPDNYLNRLAHDGVNGLWLTIKFRDLCRSDIFPEFGMDSDRRLEKLRRTVRQCARYGIKIFPFCIEPAGFDKAQSQASDGGVARHPELMGHQFPEGRYFCPSSDIGRRYMEEATFTLFNAVPDLGGLIAIQLGERPTHCRSAIDLLFENNCPRCSRRHTGEVFAEVWSAMSRGMHRVNPHAEFISWLYVPVLENTPGSTADQKVDMLRRIAACVPPGVTLQLNMESGGSTVQFGRSHPIDDYSLSYIGPSDVFAQCAEEVRRGGGRMSAKLQVASSHEVATTAYVPVPGNLYRKYEAMHGLGVSTVMQCWYFGNYPSPMTKAAGELSFAPRVSSENEFLRELASLYWPGEADAVVAAWKYFQEGYAQFPASVSFSWFGPVHDSIAWPLHLKPVDQPISPSWQLGWPASGDRVGECISYEFTLEECVELCGRMSQAWRRGVDILREVVHRTGRGGDQLDVAEAMELQLSSAHRVMQFYHLRGQLPQVSPARQLRTLNEMRLLAEDEIAASRRLATIAERDSRLGFHSEAEGYKYFPQKLLWRADLLEQLLSSDFPEVRSAIDHGERLFTAYTGEVPAGLQYECRRVAGGAIRWADVPVATCSPAAGTSASWSTLWQAVDDGVNLRIHIMCDGDGNPALRADVHDPFWRGEFAAIYIESRRMGPSHIFLVNALGQMLYSGRRSGPAGSWHARVERDGGNWSAVVTISHAALGPDRSGRPRLDIRRTIPGMGQYSWAGLHPLRPRLIFGSDNPADYGWLILPDADGA